MIRIRESVANENMINSAKVARSICKCGHDRKVHDMGRDGDCLQCSCMSYESKIEGGV